MALKRVMLGRYLARSQKRPSFERRAVYSFCISSHSLTHSASQSKGAPAPLYSEFSLPLSLSLSLPPSLARTTVPDHRFELVRILRRRRRRRCHHAPRSFVVPRPPRVVARDGDKIYREARARAALLSCSPTYRMVSSSDSAGSAESQSDAAPRDNMFKLLLIIEAPEISS